jgi:hypothetical protein
VNERFHANDFSQALDVNPFLINSLSAIFNLEILLNGGGYEPIGESFML